MKSKSIAFLFFIIHLCSMYSQTLSPQWNTIQNCGFTVSSGQINQLDVADQNTLWGKGIDYKAPLRNYNWFTTTNNGGASYTSGSIFSDTSTFVLSNIQAIDANNAWVSAFYKSTFDRGVVYHTTNGGATWINGGAANMYTVSGSSFINWVCFLSPSVGITLGDPIGGEFEIYRTTNAGGAWAAIAGSAIPNPLPGEYGKVAAFAKYGANNIWFGTSKNRIYRSTDAGQTWSVSAAFTSTLGAAKQLTDIAFSDSLNGLAKAYFGSYYFSGVTLWKTSNGGANWSQIPVLDPNFGRLHLCAIPGTSFYASCEGVPFAGNTSYKNVISYSTDEGVTWIDWGSIGIPYFSIAFANAGVGWCGSVSNSVTAGQGGIYKFSGPPLGVDENLGLHNELFLDIHPNPNSGTFIVSSKQDISLVLTDEMGQLIITRSLNENNGRLTSFLNLEDGIYLLSGFSGAKCVTKKIIIRK